MEEKEDESCNISKYWLAEEVVQYIINYLDKIFPESIIIRETNGKVDIMILDKNLPVEIQSTTATKNRVRVSTFEDNIRRQIEQNIEISGKCWFFIDENFIKFLNDTTNRNISANLDWLYQLWKSEKVKIFTITYDGIIRELIKTDWKFLTKMSNTCKLSVDDDYRILQKNKSRIIFNVLKSFEFTTKEISEMYNSFLSKNDRKKYYSKFENYLRRNDTTKRELLYANVISSAYFINNLNDALHRTIEEKNMDRHLVQRGALLGLFERNEVYTNDSHLRIKFLDKYDIAKYFPGYIKNKEMWDYLKTRYLSRNEFYGVVTGTYSYKLIKQQSMLEDF